MDKKTESQPTTALGALKRVASLQGRILRLVVGLDVAAARIANAVERIAAALESKGGE